MKRSSAKKTKMAKQKKNLIAVGILLILAVTGIIIASYFQQTRGKTENSRASAASSGWLSGAACNGVPDGSFASWRGSPVTIAGTWNDGDVETQKNQWTLDTEYGNWDQSMDVTVGAFWGDKSQAAAGWANAANGGDDANLRAALQAINAKWGNKKTIFIRYAHEFNGNWDPWLVDANGNENYKKAFANFYNLVQQELVSKGRDAKVVWSPNSDDHNGIGAIDSWPGDQYVDVVGVDFYDWDVNKDQATWDSNFNKKNSYGSPTGVGSWQAFAKAHGKPIAFPEWGTSGYGPIDDPFFIQKMNEFFRANAGTGPGQVWYEIYFNCAWSGNAFQIYPEASLPQTSAMYKSLKWGDANTSTSPGTSTSPAPTNITPSYVCAGSSTGSVCPTTTTVEPSGSTTVTNSPDNLSPTNGTGGSPTISGSPDNGNGNGGGYQGGGRRGGFFGWFFQLLALILEFLRRLFG